MRFVRLSFGAALLFLLSFSCPAQDKTTGAIKGKVRVEKGSPAGVAVILRQGEAEVARTATDKKGDFVIAHITPGIYGVTLRKSGLSTSSVDPVEVKAGKTRSLGDNLRMPVDEGSIALVRGSVFTEEGRSVPYVKVELARLLADGSVQKLDSRVTGETGEFVFRLPPDPAKYRVTLKADGAQPSARDVEVDGAAVYRTALSLKPVPR
jgi:hypothetical protein